MRRDALIVVAALSLAAAGPGVASAAAKSSSKAKPAAKHATKKKTAKHKPKPVKAIAPAPATPPVIQTQADYGQVPTDLPAPTPPTTDLSEVIGWLVPGPSETSAPGIGIVTDILEGP
jgi:hypothetical protein